MSASLVLLDTSALTTHFFEEDGWRTVQEVLDQDGVEVTVSVLSLFEFHFVLKARGLTARDMNEAMAIYREVFDEAVSIDAGVVGKAIELRESVEERIPLTDALIAACAVCRHATLVHRDRHLGAISEKLVKQIRLPDK